jgi:acyl carrier protein
MITRREEFTRRMLVWLNEEVAPKGVRVDADTPLFATRLLDSLKVLELIAFTEQAIGRPIPDSHIRMDNFQTVARIATVFLPLPLPLERDAAA